MPEWVSGFWPEVKGQKTAEIRPGNDSKFAMLTETVGDHYYILKGQTVMFRPWFGPDILWFCMGMVFKYWTSPSPGPVVLFWLSVGTDLNFWTCEDL